MKSLNSKRNWNGKTKIVSSKISREGKRKTQWIQMYWTANVAVHCYNMTLDVAKG